jgi:pimeloyl-ACP methyl ester carboxylesterase/tellurite resistance protein
MKSVRIDQEVEALASYMKAYGEYSVDAIQRSIIFLDVLRKRGNTYIEHLRSGQPPVLTFNYEMILDGHNFERPVNFALVRISDRRKREDGTSDGQERRRQDLKDKPVLPKRPIIIIDPRAGHGPGIGGSRRDSEIGMALDYDHPVYFILFYTEPMPGQTLADVEAAEARFVEEVVKRHSYADSPAIMGNCQAGWAAALLCADRPDITGPLVLNGAPLSYWAGVEGVNPMRYRGGLAGGSWMNSLLSDLGNGKFDGAHLVTNFESLNPANTIWTKNYNVYSQIDTEEERFLKFEKWWGGFFMMTAEEIHFIVSNLFVGNKLEKGDLELRRGEKISLKNIESPILVFASRGDNITPPQQALNWIPRVYHSVDEIKERGQVVIYVIHEDIGHLGIFVSASVAKKEHKEIISNFDMIDYMPPGLYEMVIEGDVKTGNFKANFEERTLDDIAAMDDGTEDEEDFQVVAAVSDINDDLYRMYLRPWVQLWTTELSAEMIRWLHPLRFQRYMISDMNPMFRPLASVASLARSHRRPVSPDNPFVEWEKNMSSFIAETLNLYRDTRDRFQEQTFRWIYGLDALHHFFTPTGAKEQPAETKKPGEEIRPLAFEDGGTAAALIRAMMAMARTSPVISRKHYTIAESIAQTHKVLKKIRPAVFKRIVKAQARLLQADEEKALDALAAMLPNPADRMEALEVARRIALVDGAYNEKEKAMLERIRKGLGLGPQKVPVLTKVK